MLGTLQTRKLVLVGVAGACALAGCEPSLAGEYEGKITFDAKHILGSPAHATITKGDGSEVAPGMKRLEEIKLIGPELKQCTLIVTEHSTKKDFLLTTLENGCVFTSGGTALPAKAPGTGSLDGNKFRFDINGTMPLSFAGERAH